LSLARLSVFIEIFAYIALAQNTRGAPLQFILSSGLSSLGGAASPAIQSLALALTSPQDTGRLFASIGVLTCVFAQIIGPIFFLVIYLNSITTYPELVFVAGYVKRHPTQFAASGTTHHFPLD
jgi:MFS family permease